MRLIDVDDLGVGRCSRDVVPAADVMQEHMDRVMAEILNGKAEMIPLPDRYKELKKVTYGGRK